MTWSLHIYGNSPKCTVKLCVGVHFPVIFTDLMGLWLWCYGCRMLLVRGEEVLFRDIFFRKHRYSLDDIRSVRWNHDGFVFSGSTGKLFTARILRSIKDRCKRQTACYGLYVICSCLVRFVLVWSGLSLPVYERPCDRPCDKNLPAYTACRYCAGTVTPWSQAISPEA